MKRVRNIVIALALVVGLAYLGLKGYIYYQVKSNLDAAIASAAPVAEIRYGGIESSLTGSVSVTDLSVRAFGEEIHLADARIGTPNVLVLLSTLSELRQGEAPEFLELRLTGLDVGLNGPLMNFAQAALQSQAPELPKSYPCGGKVVFGPAAWRAMGYQRLSSDVFLRVDTDKDARRVKVQSDWKTANMGAMSVRAEFAGLAPSLQAPPDTSDTILRWFEVDYKDHSYYKRWVQYCAKRDKTDPTSFIHAVVNADPTYYMYSWGIVPGSDLRRAYGEFLRVPKSVSVVAHPSVPVKLNLLDHYSPDDLMALLDVRVIVNGHGVESSKVSYEPELLQRYAVKSTAKLQWPPPTAQTPRAPAPPPQATAPPTQAKAPPPAETTRPTPSRPSASKPAAPPPPQSASSAPSTAKPDSGSTARAPRNVRHAEPEMREFSYRTVATASLQRYVGRYVRVRTQEGTEREGVLSAVQATELVVERRMYGGSVGVPVPMSKIDRVEVWLPQDS